jgi:hypothetical protein
MTSAANNGEAAIISANSTSAKNEMQDAVVHLTTTMTLQAGTKTHVTCASAINIETSPGLQVAVSALTPITLHVKSRRTISPSAALGAEFAHGWNSLPEELKLHILSFSLTAKGREVKYQNARGYFTLQDTLLSHFLMGPEIALLAHDAFYKENTIIIRALVSNNPDRHEVLRLPPYVSRKAIRFLRLVLDCDYIHWWTIKSCATAWLGFLNLQHIQIVFSWHKGSNEECNHFLDCILFGQTDHISFSCAGEVVFRGSPSLEIAQRIIQFEGSNQASVENTIRSLVSFTK